MRAIIIKQFGGLDSLVIEGHFALEEEGDFIAERIEAFLN